MPKVPSIFQIGIQEDPKDVRRAQKHVERCLPRPPWPEILRKTDVLIADDSDGGHFLVTAVVNNRDPERIIDSAP